MILKRLQKISSQKILIILLLICAAVFGMAYIMETYFEIYGCQMCHYERNIFIGAGGISLFCLIVLPERFQYYAVLILGFIFLGGALFAAYHVAIQQHLASLPSFCPPYDINTISSVKLVHEQHPMTPFIRCDQVTWSLFGLSLAVYNALASICLALLCWIWAWAYQRK